jgi:hypothetical protein
MDELASDSPAKGTRSQKAATATKTAAGEEDGGEDVRVLSTEEVAAVAATAARAPDVPKAALLALIHHFIDTDYRVKEGSKAAQAMASSDKGIAIHLGARSQSASTTRCVERWTTLLCVPKSGAIARYEFPAGSARARMSNRRRAPDQPHLLPDGTAP